MMVWMQPPGMARYGAGYRSFIGGSYRTGTAIAPIFASSPVRLTVNYSTGELHAEFYRQDTHVWVDLLAGVVPQPVLIPNRISVYFSVPTNSGGGG
jgi:hypothetical protein